MFDIHEFLYKKVAPVIGFILALCISIPFIMNYFSYTNSIMKTDKGYITEKRYVPSSAFLFTSSETQYRIYISVYYEGSMGMKETEKYFVVEKEVFDQYKVGDFFDSTII